MSDRATCWSVTINNPVASDEDRLAEARQKGWKVIGQLEKGENGTPHYQLLVSTPQVRFSAMKKAFPRAHIEVCRNKAALASYVKKEETREGELPQTESKFPSLAGFYKLLIPRLFELTDKRLRIHFEGGWFDTKRMCDRDQRLLDALDEGSAELIRMGYHVETLVVNPQTRSAWKRFGMDIIEITIAEMSADRQTDRQVAFISPASSITADGEDRTDAESSDQGPQTEDEGEDQCDTGNYEDFFPEDDSGSEGQEDSESCGGD